ncbi:Hypothetical protein MELLADRAFT_124039 [Melampsora larici-populina 98AG31]|uniref:Metallo-beta-lactamase domain-containing protein n=1 Tax=Melampsora larici-populina (strain 98AG31 / pathotype 3-4-7) TaxID=747676 RepID=F4RL64_MELLP|nr:Hypothetical protein MELLADRAFT_124039 [Melampsora larici-populina 98AG31]EGG06920.1 Hypothetical protein MELLADRAFT_124039 [Melampsora larici-populina 98AG31]
MTRSLCSFEPYRYEYRKWFLSFLVILLCIHISRAPLVPIVGKENGQVVAKSLATDTPTTTNLEMIFLGTGPSGRIPEAGCILGPEGPCAGCKLAMAKSTDSPVFDKRGNTSAILRFVPPTLDKNEKATPKTILIDAGKSFQTSALELFKRNGLSKIDAVLLTHPHADASLGLDDLRSWTSGANPIQKTMAIYCDQDTFLTIKQMFPYMIDPSTATGGGSVPTFQWNIFEREKPLDLFGLRVTPLTTHHGTVGQGQDARPYECAGFLFDRSIVYMSDVSSIPESTWTALASLGVPSSIPSETHPQPRPSLPILVIDTLRLVTRPSHFGIEDALNTAHRLGAQKTYLVGFEHGVTHKSWERACKAFGEGIPNIDKKEVNTQMRLVDIGKDPELFHRTALYMGKPKSPMWVRPAFDGLKISTNGETAQDDHYS